MQLDNYHVLHFKSHKNKFQATFLLITRVINLAILTYVEYKTNIISRIRILPLYRAESGKAEISKTHQDYEVKSLPQ
jgi:hypothetical protein